MLWGIERIASRVATITTGRISSASVSPAERMLCPSPNAYTNKPSASRPYTIDGTPARLVMLISMMSVTQFFGAYSSRYTPAATPSGTATAAVTTITSVDPTHADRIPACSGRRDGNEVKKSRSSRGTPLIAMSAKSAVKVSTPMSRHTSPSTPNRKSRRLCFAMSSRIWRTSSPGILVRLAEPAPQRVPEDVEDQGQQHQRQPRGEDGLVPDRAVRQVAERPLHDERGDRRRRFQRVERQVGLHAGCEREDHGLADRARYAENVRRREPGERGRNDNFDRCLEARRPHRVGALAQGHRHRAHRILADRGNVRNDHDPHDKSRREQVESGQLRIDPLQQRRHEEQREVAVHDGRDS